MGDILRFDCLRLNGLNEGTPSPLRQAQDRPNPLPGEREQLKDPVVPAAFLERVPVFGYHPVRD